MELHTAIGFKVLSPCLRLASSHAEEHVINSWVISSFLAILPSMKIISISKIPELAFGLFFFLLNAFEESKHIHELTT